MDEKYLINFVTESESNKWVLRRWCEEWKEGLSLDRVEISIVHNNKADVNVFCNYALYSEDCTTRKIGVFTHQEAEDPLSTYFEYAATQMDWCFCQSEPTLMKVLKHTNKASILQIGIDKSFLDPSPLLIGVVGREYDSGRKNYDLLESLKEFFSKSNVEFVTAKAISFESMPSFYKALDYLLVIATNEGGPMPVKEAWGLKKPLILPTGVGWCDDFISIKYSNEQELKEIIRKLIPQDDWAMSSFQILDKCRSLV